jgi:ABC-2 type transport system permease protein
VVALFVRLKLSLLKNRFRQGPSAILQLVGSIVLVGFLTVMGIGGLLAARFAGSPAIATDVLTILQFLQAVGWAVSPLLAFGIDETLDPRRFALLPLSRSTLVRGLLAAALIGVFPIGNALVLAGGAVAVASPWWTLVLSVPAAALQLIFCIVLSRALAASMAGLLQSRRGRDLAVLVGVIVVLLPQGLNVLLSGAAGQADPGAMLLGLAAPARWLPPGALAHVAADAGAGSWGLVGLDLLIGVGAVLLVALWWRTALSRSLVRPDASTAQNVSRRGPLSGLAERLFAGPVGLIAGRDLRLAGRDPIRRMSWATGVVIGIVVPAVPIFSGQGPIGGAFSGWMLALLLGIQAANQFGFDGSGLWQHLVIFGSRAQARAEVLGHAVAVLLPGVPLVFLSAVVFPLIVGQPQQIPVAIGLMLAVFGGVVAGACVSSVWTPYGVPQSRTSAFASSAPGQSGRAFAALLIAAAVAVPTALPAGILLALSAFLPALVWAVLVVGVLSAAAAVTLGVRVAGDAYAARGPAILAVVASGDRS